jgi:rubredoxin
MMSVRLAATVGFWGLSEQAPMASETARHRAASRRPAPGSRAPGYPGDYNQNHCRTPSWRVDVSEPQTWMCLICGWIYDEAAGDPDHGIAPGTAWADVPMNWTCPECGARKEDFEMVRI